MNTRILTSFRMEQTLYNAVKHYCVDHRMSMTQLLDELCRERLARAGRKLP